MTFQNIQNHPPKKYFQYTQEKKYWMKNVVEANNIEYGNIEDRNIEFDVK